MSVPKATLHKDDLLVTSKNNVGSASEPWTMETETESHPMHD